MAWLMRLPDGRQVSSDDFTLGDLGDIETETGQPWSVLNVFRDIKVAKAFLKVAYRSHGFDVADVDGLTLGVLKTTFDFVEDEPFPGDQEADDGPLGRSSGGSSRGASAGSTGSRRKRAASA